MVGPKSAQTKVVRDEMHFYTFFIETPLLETLDVGMYLVCYYPFYCLYTFWPYHPYVLFQFI